MSKSELRRLSLQVPEIAELIAKNNLADQTIKHLGNCLKEANELILDLFAQGTLIENKYDHMCMGTYESSQDYLIKHGLIKESECIRK